MLVYSLHHGCQEKIDKKMVTLIVNSIPPQKMIVKGYSNFDIEVVSFCPEKADPKGSDQLCTPLELAIQLQRIDIAKQLVIAGAHPICVAENNTEQVLPLFLEYYEFGTNHFYSWLLHEHVPHDKVSAFIDQVLKKGNIIFDEYAKETFEKESGRHHAHPPLTCGHAGMIKRFIECFSESKSEYFNEDPLRVKDSDGRTALQIAAANGDLESFTTLLGM